MVQCILFGSISYFMYGFDPQPDKFFIHWGTLVGITLSFIELVRYLFITSPLTFQRMFGVFSKTLFVGQQILLVATLFTSMYTGFFIPYPKMKSWVKGIFKFDLRSTLGFTGLTHLVMDLKLFLQMK